MARKGRNGAVKSPGRSTRRPVVHSDPAWEAMKAARRNLRPADAVRECAFLSEQYRSIKSMAEINLKSIILALQAKKVPFVLTGAHAIATWTGRPRATADVDILVKSGRNHARAVKAIQATYPELEMRNFAGMAAFFVPGETQSVIDVTYPHREDIRQSLETAIWIEDQGLEFRVPRLEAALANKYGASLAPMRDAGKRGQDMVDFFNMVRHSLDEGRERIDMEWLAELGEMVWPGGGGKELVELVQKAKAGEVPRVDVRKKNVGRKS